MLTSFPWLILRASRGVWRRLTPAIRAVSSILILAVRAVVPLRLLLIIPILFLLLLSSGCIPRALVIVAYLFYGVELVHKAGIALGSSLSFLILLLLLLMLMRGALWRRSVSIKFGAGGGDVRLRLLLARLSINFISTSWVPTVVISYLWIVIAIGAALRF